MDNLVAYEFANNQDVRTRRFAQKLAERGHPMAEEFRLVADIFREMSERAKAV